MNLKFCLKTLFFLVFSLDKLFAPISLKKLDDFNLYEISPSGGCSEIHASIYSSSSTKPQRCHSVSRWPNSTPNNYSDKVSVLKCLSEMDGDRFLRVVEQAVGSDNRFSSFYSYSDRGTVVVLKSKWMSRKLLADLKKLGVMMYPEPKLATPEATMENIFTMLTTKDPVGFEPMRGAPSSSAAKKTPAVKPAKKAKTFSTKEDVDKNIDEKMTSFLSEMVDPNLISEESVEKEVDKLKKIVAKSFREKLKAQSFSEDEVPEKIAKGGAAAKETAKMVNDLLHKSVMDNVEKILPSFGMGSGGKEGVEKSWNEIIGSDIFLDKEDSPVEDPDKSEEFSTEEPELVNNEAASEGLFDDYEENNDSGDDRSSAEPGNNDKGRSGNKSGGKNDGGGQPNNIPKYLIGAAVIGGGIYFVISKFGNKRRRVVVPQKNQDDSDEL